MHLRLPAVRYTRAGAPSAGSHTASRRTTHALERLHGQARRRLRAAPGRLQCRHDKVPEIESKLTLQVGAETEVHQTPASAPGPGQQASSVFSFPAEPPVFSSAHARAVSSHVPSVAAADPPRSGDTTSPLVDVSLDSGPEDWHVHSAEAPPSVSRGNRLSSLIQRLRLVWQATRSYVALAALSVGMIGLHACGLVWQWCGAVAAGLGIAAWGYRSGSLSLSGAVAAFLVGCSTVGCSLRFGATLLAFFFSSSRLTKYKADLKEGLEGTVGKPTARTWVQVVCNGLVPSLIAVVYGALTGCVDLPLAPTTPSIEPARADLLTFLMGSFLGYYSCCCGDTWASEVGPLSSQQPRLVTTLRPVRRGTNGGVTLLGLACSALGGLFVGITFYGAALVSPTLWIFEHLHAAAAGQWILPLLGMAAGLFGSLLDSLLGATLQYSGFDVARQCIVSKPGTQVEKISGLPLLSNNLVNLFSASFTSLLVGLLAVMLVG